MRITLDTTPPTPREAFALRETTGWAMPSVERLASALDASCAHVTARDEAGTLIGMARAVGDGVLNLYIQDVMVHPDMRACGIARDMVADLLARLQSQAQPMTTIGLLAVAGLEPFYESLGFTRRPDGQFGAGMMLFTQ